MLGCAHQEAWLAARPSATAAPPLRLLPTPVSALTRPPQVSPLPTPPPEAPAPLAAAVTPEPPQSPPAAPPPEQETATQAVPLHILAGAVEPLHADDPTLPDRVLMASRGKVLQGSYKLCISREGKVQSVTPVVGIEGVDHCVVEALKTWQFPKLPVLLCKLQTLRFEIP